MSQSDAAVDSYKKVVEKADELVKGCESRNVGRTIQRMRLGKAKDLYKEAFKKAQDDEQRATTARSLFETDAKLCDLYLDLDNSYFKNEMVQASNNACLAISLTKAFPPDSEWVKELQDGFIKFVEKFLEVMREEEEDDEFTSRYPGIVAEVAPLCTQNPEMVVNMYSVLIDRFLGICEHERESCTTEEDFRKLTKLCNMCYHYVEEVISMLETRPFMQPSAKFGDWESFKQKIIGEMSDRKERANIEQRSVATTEAFFEGESKFQTLLRDVKLTADSDDWMIVVDAYYRGLSEIRNHEVMYDPETEDPKYVNNALGGRGYKLIGDLYYKLYGQQNADCFYQKANKYGILANLPKGTIWFDETQKWINSYQTFQSQDSSVQKREETQIRLVPHNEHFQQIRNLTPREVLPKMYELFPPRGKHENMKIPDFHTVRTDLEWTKAYRKARKVYNPDKVRDLEWEAICGELLKIINLKHDEMSVK